MTELDTRRLEAPWDDDQVDALNRFQIVTESDRVTCPNRVEIITVKSRREKGTEVCGRPMRATRQGWRCMFCYHAQSWAYRWQLTARSWIAALRAGSPELFTPRDELDGWFLAEKRRNG